MDDPRPRLLLLTGHGDSRPGSPTAVPEAAAEPEPEPASVLRRRYTVTVQPDGTELVDDVEEWTE
jgi:hypothetical protein